MMATPGFTLMTTNFARPRRRLACDALIFAALALTACSDPDSGSATESETGEHSTSGETTGTTQVATTDLTTEEPTTDTGSETTEGDAAITYHRDIRPVLAASCEQCHSPGNIAPFPLMNYDEVYELRELVALTVANRQMPPWLAQPGCGSFEHDPSLAQETIDMIEAWVDDGAPEGNPADYVAPPPPPALDLPRVDIELAMPEPYTPAGSPDDYRCFILDWPEANDAYVTGFRAVPGSIDEVHHAIAFAMPPEKLAEYEQLDADAPGPGYECFGGPGGELNTPEDAGIWLGAWAPGAASSVYPAGTGLHIQPGSKVILQVHYNVPVSGPVPDETKVQFMVEDSVEREGFMMLWADVEWLFGSMHIPAGESSVVHSWELDPTAIMSFLTDVISPNVPIEIHGVTHHMHTIGVRGSHFIRRSAGGNECLLEIPRWDFNWQRQYLYTNPLTLNPGDALHLECEYDNSAGAHDVNWGDGTNDEMCLGIYYITEAG